jgi:hypothetical protein
MSAFRIGIVAHPFSYETSRNFGKQQKIEFGEIYLNQILPACLKLRSQPGACRARPPCRAAVNGAEPVHYNCGLRPQGRLIFFAQQRKWTIKSLRIIEKSIRSWFHAGSN